MTYLSFLLSLTKFIFHIQRCLFLAFYWKILCINFILLNPHDDNSEKPQQPGFPQGKGEN